MKIGERARQIRLSKGITQVFVAKKLGYQTPSAVNDFEKGRRNISADKIPLLAMSLGVTVAELYDEKIFEEKVRETRSETA
jgi:transcriptional regulator with XRE-family HTH domain